MLIDGNLMVVAVHAYLGGLVSILLLARCALGGGEI
jgi:hypothetical protein